MKDDNVMLPDHNIIFQCMIWRGLDKISALRTMKDDNVMLPMDRFNVLPF
jgi:hypothetical protein